MIEVNGRRYEGPKRPTVVICVDGCAPDYLSRAIRDGIIPTIASFERNGFFADADAVLPTFTNPNNVSIVTGAPSAVHGISGNYYLDPESGREVMITDASLLRCETILAQMSHAGVRTVAITAKDKLRKMLGRNLRGISFSSERADEATIAENGITGVEDFVGRPKPAMYSADLSLYVLDAGIRLIECQRAELLYLSLSDYVQHAHAPGEPESDAFLASVDERVRHLVDLGALVGLVADHGMNDKSKPNGEPNVVFLEEELERRFGERATRVICPITDPFVRHHGALGSFVRVYRRKASDQKALMEASARLPGVAEVMDGAAAARRFEMPLDREGDFVVLGDARTAIGSRRLEHDLSGLAGHRLRSHGGLEERRVPFILSKPLNPAYQQIAASRRLRNFDIFEFSLNGVS
jgi:phosphonoacetate hydrolase